MSLEAYGDEGDVSACEDCIGMEDLITDLVSAIKKIAATPVYQAHDMSQGVSVELIAAILQANELADQAGGGAE